jgi:hypothetical protein
MSFDLDQNDKAVEGHCLYTSLLDILSKNGQVTKTI